MNNIPVIDMIRCGFKESVDMTVVAMQVMVSVYYYSTYKGIVTASGSL